MNNQRILFGICGLGFRGAGAENVELALTSIVGVASAYVDRGTEMAYVRFDPRKLGPEDLMAAVRVSGYGIEEPILIS